MVGALLRASYTGAMGLFKRAPAVQQPVQPDAYQYLQMPAYPDGLDELGLQLYPADYFERAGLRPQEYVAQEDIPGVATTIIIDQPDSVMVLVDDEAGSWNAHRKAVMARLKEQLRQAEPYDVSFVDMAPNDADSDGVIALIDHSDITTATHALVLEELYPQLLGSKGALVGIPLRHLILVKKLHDKPDPAVVAAFRNLVSHMAEDSEAYLSDAAYVYHNGKYTFAPLG